LSEENPFCCPFKQHYGFPANLRGVLFILTQPIAYSIRFMDTH
jgi:hypothetical protein